MLKRLTLGLAACLATLAPTLAQTVGRAEYFFDTDPGVGAANALTYTTPGDSSDQVFTVPISTLSQGFHQLGVRVKAGGKWGPAFSRVFYKLAVSSGTVATPVSKAEYFVDVDPGVGLGSPIAVSTSGDSVQLSPAIPVASLSSGFHLLAVRFRNSQGHWGEAITRIFYKLGTGINNPLTGRPARGEYYFDTDPGVGAGRPMAAFTRGDSVNLLATIPVTGLSKGFHTLGARFADSAGHWSEAAVRVFFIAPRIGQALGAAPPLARAEFFYDTDPGAGNGRRVANFVPGEIVDFTTYLSVRGLSGGYHTLYARVADSAGTWSVPVAKTFLVNAPGLRTVTPKEGGNIGPVTMTITGFGFNDSCRVKLVRLSGTGGDITVPDTLVRALNGRTLYAALDLTGKDTGRFDVQVTYRGRRDTTLTLARSFRIVKGTIPDVSAEIIGYEQMRNHNWIPFNLVISNRGNTDAKAVPVFVQVPANAIVRWENIRPNMADYPGNADSLKREFSGVIVDSALGTDDKRAKTYAFVLPLLTAGQVRSINFSVYTEPPYEFLYRYSAWALPPMTGPSYIQNARTNDLGCSLLTVDAGKKAALLASLGFLPNLTPAQRQAVVDLAYETIRTRICAAVSANQSSTRGALFPGPLAVIDLVKLSQAAVFSAAQSSGLSVGYSTLLNIVCTYNISIYNNVANNTGNSSSWSGYYATLAPSSRDNHSTTVVTAVDPNEKLGSTGAGRGRFITTGGPMRYVIRFENLETATAPAQTVTIRDTLDRTVFDPSTIELGFVGFGDTIALPPRGLSQWQTEVGLFPYKPYTVRITARYSDTTGILTWYFQTLNPASLTPINNPTGGFLPPNVYPPQGQGAVFFTINTKPNIPTNTLIRNRASIIFDQNQQILTAPWINTADATPPVSAVQGLPPGSPTRFGVVWGGTDVGSGVMNYTVYVRTNGGPYKIWKANTDSTYGLFTGILDSTYAFYSVARDSALNLEEPPALPDAVTIISGLDKQEVAAGLRLGVVPNPNNGSFTLTILGLKSKAELSVLDMSGRPVLTRELDADTQSRSIHLPDVVKGLYMVRVRSNQGTVLRRMVVE